MFQAVLASVKQAKLRPEVIVTQLPAPANLAPHAVALAADITPLRHAADSDLGTGRIVILYDDTEPGAWGGSLRVICFAKAPLESDLGLDPMLADVAWSWLIEALDGRGANYHSPSGTATKTINTGYGELGGRTDGTEIEIRASWTPADAELMTHVEAWGDLLCQLAGLPPLPDGISLLDSRRSARGQ